MADRPCTACGRPLESDAGPRRRLCRREDCERQRVRARVNKHRTTKAATVVELHRERPTDPNPSGSLIEAVREALDEARATDTWEGRNALALAKRMEAAGSESGSAFAALSAKLESAMDRALRPRPGQSFADELRRKRQERLSG